MGVGLLPEQLLRVHLTVCAFLTVCDTCYAKLGPSLLDMRKKVSNIWELILDQRPGSGGAGIQSQVRIKVPRQCSSTAGQVTVTQEL